MKNYRQYMILFWNYMTEAITTISFKNVGFNLSKVKQIASDIISNNSNLRFISIIEF